jgi:hypothetical protein
MMARILPKTHDDYLRIVGWLATAGSEILSNCQAELNAGFGKVEAPQDEQDDGADIVDLLIRRAREDASQLS